MLNSLATHLFKPSYSILNNAFSFNALEDTIYAVLKGSSINNNGSEKTDYFAPSVQGQAHLIGEALTVAEIDSNTIGYVEAHGTGTLLGDPIELCALAQAYRQWTSSTNYCALAP